MAASFDRCKLLIDSGVQIIICCDRSIIEVGDPHFDIINDHQGFVVVGFPSAHSSNAAPCSTYWAQLALRYRRTDGRQTYRADITKCCISADVVNARNWKTAAVTWQVLNSARDTSDVNVTLEWKAKTYCFYLFTLHSALGISNGE